MSDLATIAEGPLVKEEKKPLKKLATTSVVVDTASLESSDIVISGSSNDGERRLSCAPLETIDENDASWSKPQKPTTYAEFYLKLRRSGSLAVPAGEYTDKQKEELLDLFNMYDLNNDNKLSKDDLLKIFKAVSPRYTEEMVENFIKSATNQESSSEMTYEHFKNFIGGTFFGKYTRLELHYVFNCLDRDGDGFLDKDDLESAFTELGWTQKYEASEMIRAMDRQNRGKVCFEDFKDSMNNFV